mgnify:CR=1 FL=1
MINKEGIMSVNINELIRRIDGEVLTKADQLEQIKISDGYVSDLLSDVMGNAKEHQVWITIMKHLNVIAVAALANMSCVCFANNVSPDQAVIDKANEEGICLIKSPFSTFEIAGNLYQLLHKG